MTTRAVLPLLLSACVTRIAPDTRESAAERFSVLDGTADAIGMLAFVNDAGSTKALLDVDAGLDARAAAGIVAHRDGPDARTGTADDDLFQTIAELDAVYYVGDSALTAILQYALDHGFVPTEPDDVLGTWDGVPFTLGEADAVLDQVNTASYAALDVDAALDKRAVDAIFAARPVDTVAELAGLSYVGTSALQKLQVYAAAQASPVWSTDALEAAFATADAGVLFPSESDVPLDPVTVTGAYPVDAATVKDALAAVYVPRPGESPLADRAVEVKSVDEALGFLLHPEDWWSEYEVDRAAQWSAILDVVGHLDHPQVFRLGDRDGNWLSGAIDVYVIGGSAEGDLVGFHTISVET